MLDDPLAALLAGKWRPALSITGAAGLPFAHRRRNVLRPHTAAKLSLRLPPTVGAAHAAKRLKETLAGRAAVRRARDVRASRRARLGRAGDRAVARGRDGGARRKDYFGQPAMSQARRLDSVHGDAGRRYPQAQFMITGVLGPTATPTGRTSTCTCRRAWRVTGVCSRRSWDHANARALRSGRAAVAGLQSVRTLRTPGTAAAMSSARRRAARCSTRPRA